MKPKFTASAILESALKCSQTIPHRVFDENAETTKEIALAAGMSERQTQIMIAKMLDARKWEQVWKRGRTKPVPAYRPCSKAR